MGTTIQAEAFDVRYRNVHGYRRAFRMAGDGPPLLLLHGIGDSSLGWLPLMPALAEHNRVIAPDLLGHGQSAKPRADYAVAAYANGMRDLLDVLNVERATVVGHSLGGGVAAQFAYQYPERCERLVLVATGGAGRRVSPVLRFAAAPFAEFVLPTVSWPGVRLAQTLALEVLRRSGNNLGRDVDEVRRVLDGLPDRAARVAFIRTLRSAVDWRGQVITMLDRSYLAESVPVLLVWGSDDGVIPVAHAHIAQQAMPNSKLVIFERAGHFPHHADPDRFISELNTFIETTEPALYERAEWRQRLLRGASA